jgi:branched-chain amino acid transport system permease protein
MYTGLAGSLGAIAVQFVAPDSFGVFVSIFLFVGLVVGGVSSIGGTLIGAAFIEFVPNFADKISKAAPGAVYGVILIAVMFLMPAGAGGFLHAMWRKLFRARPGEPMEPEQSAASIPVAYETEEVLPGIAPQAHYAERPVPLEASDRDD